MINEIVRFVLSVSIALSAIVPAARGEAVGGPREATMTVGGFGRIEFAPILFRAGELAIVGVRGDGDSDLDLYAYDGLGNLVAKDEDATDVCLVMWQPRWTGYFTIVVRNRGAIANRFRMRTN